MLDEVELLVARCRGEVLPLDLAIFADFPAVRADHREGRLLPERWVGQDHRPAIPRVGREGVPNLDERGAVRGPNAVQQEVHGGQAGRAIDEFITADEVALEFGALGRGH